MECPSLLLLITFASHFDSQEERSAISRPRVLIMSRSLNSGPQTRKEGITQRMFHHHNKETLNCLRLLCVCLSVALPLKSSMLDDQLNAEFFIQRSTRSLFDSLTYKLSFYLGGKQLNCLLYLNIEVQIKSCEILPPSPFYRRMVAIVRD